MTAAEFTAAGELLFGRWFKSPLARALGRDRSMILSITEPALGFTLSLAGHVWLFNSRLEITGSVLPPPGHIDARTPDACPGCVDFSIRTYTNEEPRR